MAKKSNLSKNSVLLLIGTFLNKGLQFIMIPLFSRWLSTEDYGSFDLFSTYVSLMIPVVTLACSEAVFRYGIEKDNPAEKSIYISNGFAIVACNSVIMAIVILILRSAFNWTLAIPFFFMALGEILNNYVQGYMRSIRKLNIYSFCTALSTFCIFISSTIFVLVLDMGLTGLIWGYAIGYLIGDFTVVIITNFPQYFNVKSIKLSGIKELVAYSYVLIPNNICWWIINVSDRTIINLVLGASYNGVYAIAAKIPNLATAIFSVFSISWQESASDMADSNERNFYYNGVLNKICCILIPLCAGILACNFILFDYVFDTRYYEASLYTPILVTSVIFYTLSQFFGGIQISLKRPKANSVTTIIGAIVNLTVHIALVNMIGLYAAVISTITANVVITVARVYMLRKDIVFHVEKKVLLLALLYLYFAIMCYLNLPMIFNIINLAIAAVIFALSNFNMIKSILKNFGIKL